MSQARGPGFCHKALWYGWGGDAGCCDEPAFGPTPVSVHGVPFQGVPLRWACPEHGGPPQVAERVPFRHDALSRADVLQAAQAAFADCAKRLSQPGVQEEIERRAHASIAVALLGGCDAQGDLIHEQVGTPRDPTLPSPPPPDRVAVHVRQGRGARHSVAFPPWRVVSLHPEMAQLLASRGIIKERNDGTWAADMQADELDRVLGEINAESLGLLAATTEDEIQRVLRPWCETCGGVRGCWDDCAAYRETLEKR